MYDLKIDEAKARFWIKDVKTEISKAERTLNQLANATKETPGENDTLFKLITKTGEVITDRWNNLTGAFKKAWDGLEEGLSGLAKIGKDIAESWDGLTKKF